MESQNTIFGTTYKCIVETLKGTICDICGGFGHASGQCATLKAIDRAMSAMPDPMREMWINEKKNKINTQYHANKKERAKFVANKLLKRKKNAELELEKLTSKYT